VDILHEAEQHSKQYQKLKIRGDVYTLLMKKFHIGEKH
jgi:hypothetical protein